jgi:hypothetical protein
MTREYINPPGVPQRVHYTRVLKIDKPSKLIYIAGDVPVFLKVMNDPSVNLPWDQTRPSPSTLIGVTALSNPRFLIEVEIAAVVES